jgi:hemerythrin
MPLMQWNDKLSVGIEVFDNDHKKLVGMVNDLFDAMNSGKGKEALSRVLDGLITYTKTHFAREEEYMTKAGYPKLAAHQKEHADLARQVLDVQKKWHEGQNAVLSMEVLNFLKNWLIKHIQGSDKEYGPFLHGKGIK